MPLCTAPLSTTSSLWVTHYNCINSFSDLVEYPALMYHPILKNICTMS